METAIWWIRRDLRLENNPVLDQALEQTRRVIPLFILENQLLYGQRSSDKRRSFLFEALTNLNMDITRRGGQLVIRRGGPLQELGKIMEETRAQAIFAEPDYSPYSRKRDSRVSSQFPVTWVGSPSIHPPGSILKKDKNPYTVFTPYSRAWKAEGIPPGSQSQNHLVFERLMTELGSISIHDLAYSQHELFPASEQEAKNRLIRFIHPIEEDMYLDPPIQRYETNRDRLDCEDTSRLSPYLKFGMLSAREAASWALKCIQASPGDSETSSVESWLNELIWRDFYIQILYHYPSVLNRSFRSLKVSWINDVEQYHAWCSGETGYPVVDAAMRQLVQTGWMHNRARMIVASFLTKDLLIDWRWGEKWFLQHLLDGDLAANNGGWQWSAGTGTDAAPFFRIMNPITQGQKFDPLGMFIRAWLPELETVPIEYIHTPWMMPLSIQVGVGCRIGKDYPAPIVEHAWARERALQTFRRSADQEVGGAVKNPR